MAEAQEPPLLVLGSASPARATLLRSAGIEPVVRPSEVDEDALVSTAGLMAATADEVTQLLATAKARDVAGQVRSGEVPGTTGRRVLVVGADSLLSVVGDVLGKAATAGEVRDRWAAMAGGSGRLVTGHAVIDLPSGREVHRVVSTVVHFGRPDSIELEAYIASGEPFQVAGSCTIDGLGGPFIDGVDGDHTNVIGLSLPALRAALGSLGVRWTDLWGAA